MKRRTMVIAVLALLVCALTLSAAVVWASSGEGQSNGPLYAFFVEPGKSLTIRTDNFTYNTPEVSYEFLNGKKRYTYSGDYIKMEDTSVSIIAMNEGQGTIVESGLTYEVRSMLDYSCDPEKLWEYGEKVTEEYYPVYFCPFDAVNNYWVYDLTLNRYKDYQMPIPNNSLLNARVQKSGIWSSSNPSVALVTSNGTIKPREVGTASIRFMNEQGETELLVRLRVTKEGPAPSNDIVITFVPQSLTLRVGETMHVRAYRDQNVNVTSEGKWGSAYKSIATVENGAVTGVSAGKGIVYFEHTPSGWVGGLPVTVLDEIMITTEKLPNGWIDEPYAQQIKAVNGAKPYTFSAQGLPSWLSIDAQSGSLTGTPKEEGYADFSVTVTDAQGQSVKKIYTFDIHSRPRIDTDTLPEGIKDAEYRSTITASGGEAPYTFSATDLPTWLALDAQTGELAGVPPEVGEYVFTIKVTDRREKSNEKTLTLAVKDKLSIATAGPIRVEAGTYFSTPIRAVNGKWPYKYSSLTALPEGLSINEATGVLSGKALDESEKKYVFAVRDDAGAEATRAIQIEVWTDLVLHISEPYSGTCHEQMVILFYGEGGQAPYTFKIDGDLPPGVGSTVLEGDKMMALNGTPTRPGKYPIAVTLTDARGVKRAGSYTIHIATKQSVEIEYPAKIDILKDFTGRVTVEGGVGPYTYRLNRLSGPECNVTVDRDGVISGQFTTEGTYTFRVTVTDEGDQQRQITKDMTVTAIAPFALTPESQAFAEKPGTAFALKFKATGGVKPYAYTYTPRFSDDEEAPQVSFAKDSEDESQWVLSGTMRSQGEYPFWITAQDAEGREAAIYYLLNVEEELQIQVESEIALPDYSVSIPIRVSGGVPEYRLEIEGAAQGVMILGASPDFSLEFMNAPSKTMKLTLKATDNEGRIARKEIRLVPKEAGFSYTVYDEGTVGKAYASSVQVINAAEPIARYAITAGKAPNGLVFAPANAELSGTPEAGAEGTYLIEVTAYDSKGAVVAQKGFTLVIHPANLEPANLLESDEGVHTEGNGEGQGE